MQYIDYMQYRRQPMNEISTVVSDKFLEEREKPTNDKCMYTKTSV